MLVCLLLFVLFVCCVSFFCSLAEGKPLFDGNRTPRLSVVLASRVETRRNHRLGSHELALRLCAGEDATHFNISLSMILRISHHSKYASAQRSLTPRRNYGPRPNEEGSQMLSLICCSNSTNAKRKLVARALNDF